jgi:hypothetical protein
MLSSLEREGLPAREPLFEAVPMLHAGLAELPAEQHRLLGLRMVRREVHQAAVEILHLHTQGLELGDEARDLAGGVGDLLLELTNTLRVETATVAGNPHLDTLEPLAHMKEPATRLNELLEQRTNDLEGRVRLVLSEELHPGMLNSADA